MKNILIFSGIAWSFAKSACKNGMLVVSAYRDGILSCNFLPLKTEDPEVKERTKVWFRVCFLWNFNKVERLKFQYSWKIELKSIEKNGFRNIKLTGGELDVLLENNRWKICEAHRHQNFIHVNEKRYLKPSNKECP